MLVSSFAYIPEDCKSLESDASSPDSDDKIVNFEDHTSSEFPISLSGRDSLKYACFNLVMKPRHDIATTFITSIPLVNSMFETTRDTLWIEMPIERKENVSAELLILQQKELELAQKA